MGCETYQHKQGRYTIQGQKLILDVDSLFVWTMSVFCLISAESQVAKNVQYVKSTPRLGKAALMGWTKVKWSGITSLGMVFLSTSGFANPQGKKFSSVEPYSNADNIIPNWIFDPLSVRSYSSDT